MPKGSGIRSARAFTQLQMELSCKNEEVALELLRAWGEGTKTVRELYKEIREHLDEEK